MAETGPSSSRKTGGTGVSPVQMSGHDESHGRDARATGVGPIDSIGPANLSSREMTIARSRYIFDETALGSLADRQSVPDPPRLSLQRCAIRVNPSIAGYSPPASASR